MGPARERERQLAVGYTSGAERIVRLSSQWIESISSLGTEGRGFESLPSRTNIRTSKSRIGNGPGPWTGVFMSLGRTLTRVWRWGFVDLGAIVWC